MNGKALRKHCLHEKTAASVLLKPFINSEQCLSNTIVSYLSVPVCRSFGDPWSTGVTEVDVVDTESLTVAGVPLKVVHQRPRRESLNITTIQVLCCNKI